MASFPAINNVDMFNPHIDLKSFRVVCDILELVDIVSNRPYK